MPPPKDKRRSALVVTYELLESLLDLKEGCEIVSVLSNDQDKIYSRFQIILTGEGCSLTNEGEPLVFDNELSGVMSRGSSER